MGTPVSKRLLGVFLLFLMVTSFTSLPMSQAAVGQHLLGNGLQGGDAMYCNQENDCGADARGDIFTWNYTARESGYLTSVRIATAPNCGGACTFNWVLAIYLAAGSTHTMIANTSLVASSCTTTLCDSGNISLTIRSQSGFLTRGTVYMVAYIPISCSGAACPTAPNDNYMSMAVRDENDTLTIHQRAGSLTTFGEAHETLTGSFTVEEAMSNVMMVMYGTTPDQLQYGDAVTNIGSLVVYSSNRDIQVGAGGVTSGYLPKEQFNVGELFYVQARLTDGNGEGLEGVLVDLQIKKNQTGSFLTFQSVYTSPGGYLTSSWYSFDSTFSGGQDFRAVFTADSRYTASTSNTKTVYVIGSSAAYRITIESEGAPYNVDKSFSLGGNLFVAQGGSRPSTPVPDKNVQIWVAYTGQNWREIQGSPISTDRGGRYVLSGLKVETARVYVFKSNVSMFGGIAVQSSNLTLIVVAQLERSQVVDPVPVSVSEYVVKWKNDTGLKGDGASFLVAMFILVFMNLMLLKAGITSWPLLTINIFAVFGLVAIEILPQWVAFLNFLLLAIFAIGPLKKAFGS